MTEASKKSPAVEEMIDKVGESLGFAKRKPSIENNTCVSCQEPVVEFRDHLSRKEYSISGLCQKCQDQVFGTEDNPMNEDSMWLGEND